MTKHITACPAFARCFERVAVAAGPNLPLYAMVQSACADTAEHPSSTSHEPPSACMPDAIMQFCTCIATAATDHIGLLAPLRRTAFSSCTAPVRLSIHPYTVWCAGGTSLFPSLRERVEREVGELAAQNAKVKVTSPANTMERRFSVWLGDACS